MNGISKSSISLALLFVVISLVCLALGVNDYVHQEAWFAQAVQADGTITAYDLHVRNDGKSEFCPRIEFTTRAGEPATTYGGICPSQPDKSQIGQHVSFYYDPNNPSATRTKGWTNDEGSGLIFGAIGFFFFPAVGSISLLVEYFRKRRRAMAAYYQPGAGGLNATLLQDAEKYRANQRAAEQARKAAEHHAAMQPPERPEHAATETESPADEEVRLAALKQQEEELERKIEARRRQQGQ